MKHTMQDLIQFANDRPTSLNDDLYQWAVDAEEHIRALAVEQENIRKANIDCVDDFNQLKADYDELNAKLDAITTEAETNQKWAFLEWGNKAEELQDERDKYQKLLMRWCNDNMDTAQVKQLENETILAIKGTI